MDGNQVKLSEVTCTASTNRCINPTHPTSTKIHPQLLLDSDGLCTHSVQPHQQYINLGLDVHDGFWPIGRLGVEISKLNLFTYILFHLSTYFSYISFCSGCLCSHNHWSPQVPKYYGIIQTLKLCLTMLLRYLRALSAECLFKVVV